MHYSDNPSSVRVDIWTASGKWYETIEMVWDRYTTTIDGEIELIHKTFRRCLLKAKPNLKTRHEGWMATCLDPYHEHGHPLMLKF